MWTQAVERGYTVSHLSQWLCRAPAKLVGLDKRKGAITEGYDADLVVWNPQSTFRVEPSMILHRHKLTPYAGQTLNGVVSTTYLRGRKVYERGRPAETFNGQMLKRGAA